MAVIGIAKKFVFVKLVKTASTSLEHELVGHLEEGDLCSPYPHLDPNVTSSDFFNDAVDACLWNRHASLEELIRLHPSAIFFTKICVVREPVDWCLSHYAHIYTSVYLREKHGICCWNDYISRGVFPVPNGNISLDLGGKSCFAIDRFIRFEHLQQDSQAVFRDEIAFPDFCIKTRLRAGNRLSEGIPLRNDICDDHKQIIYKRFEELLKVLRRHEIDYSI